jgi:hypothetical protein
MLTPIFYMVVKPGNQPNLLYKSIQGGLFINMCKDSLENHRNAKENVYRWYRRLILSFFPSFSFPDLIWRKGNSFEAMTGRTAFIDGILAEVFRGFPQL